MKYWEKLCKFAAGVGGNLFFMLRVMARTAPFFMILTVLFSLMSGLGGVLQSLFLGRIVDGIRSGVPVLILCVYAAVILVFQFLAKVQNRTLFAMNRVVTEEIGVNMEKGILSRMKDVPLELMDNPQFLNRLEQARNLTKRTPNSVFMLLFGLVGLLTSAVGYFLILVRVSVWYVLFLLIGSAAMILANSRYENRVMGILFAMSPQRRRMNYFADLLTKRENFEEICSYGGFDFLCRRYEKNAREQISASWNVFRRYSAVYVLAALVSYAGCGLVYVLLIGRAAAGRISIGDLAMFLTACLGFQAVLTELIDGITALPEELFTLQNYRDFMKTLDEIEKKRFLEPEEASQGQRLVRDGGIGIEVRGLSFSYPGTQRRIFDHVSFTVAPGSRCALVGLNGAGKTTLVRLLCGFYDSYEGEIRIDGADLRQMSQEQRRQAVSVLYQNYLKPSLPLDEAVALADCGEAEQSRIKDALEESQIPVSEFSKGTGTMLTKAFSPDGIIPSGGQWQKIALARMLYRDTPLYILDEPSASLDPQAEAGLFDLIGTMRGKRTVLFITHRLASVRTADSVLYLDEGGCLWQASHEELMEKNMDYRKLYLAQAEKYGVSWTEKPVQGNTAAQQ